MQTDSITLNVDGSPMRAYVARPDGAPRGGLIVFQEAFGVNPYIRSVADRFAREGYLTVAPELFHRSAEPGFEAGYAEFETIRPHYMAVTEAGIEADARAAFDWLKGQGAEKIGAVGFCLGGRAAFVADSVLPLTRAVSFYGGGIDQITGRAKDLQAPILLIWGGKDTHIGADKRRVTMEALEAAGKPYAHIVFSEAEHGFFCDARSNYHPRSAELVWPLVLEFLK